MRTFADDLSLSAGYDEEALLVLALLHEELIHIDLFGLERTDQTVQYLVVKLREQRNRLEVLRCKRRYTVHILDGQSVVFSQLDLCAVHAERAAADLYPG